MFSVGYLEKDIQDIHSKEYPIPRDRWPIYPKKYFFTKVTCLQKKVYSKKLKKIILCSKCDLWSLQNRHSRKQQNLIYLSPKEKSFTCVAENNFLLKVDTYEKHPWQKKFWKRCCSHLQTLTSLKPAKKNKQNLGYLSPKEKSTSLVLLKIPFYVSRQISKTSIPIFFWKGVTLKLWSSLQNQHSRKQQNLRDLSPKEKTTSLVLLKIYFYVRQEHIQNFQNRKNYGKGVVLKLYSLISLKPTFVKTADSELFEPWRKKHFTGPPQNTFLCKVDAYLKLPLFSNCDLGSLWNHHSQKEQNQRYLSPNDKRTSLVLLKIPFY